MPAEPCEVEVDAATKLTISMLFLVGFACGQAGWGIKKDLAYAEPIFKMGVKRGEEVRARLALEHGKPPS